MDSVFFILQKEIKNEELTTKMQDNIINHTRVRLHP